MKSRIEILLPNKEGERVVEVGIGELQHYASFVVSKVQVHRLGRDSYYRNISIMGRLEVLKLVTQARTTGVYYLGKRMNINIYPCASTDEARELQAVLDEAVMINAPTPIESLEENAV